MKKLKKKVLNKYLNKLGRIIRYSNLEYKCNFFTEMFMSIIQDAIATKKLAKYKMRHINHNNISNRAVNKSEEKYFPKTTQFLSLGVENENNS